MATVLGSPTPAKTEIHPENYRYLQEYIYRESGIVIERDKHYLLEARLLPVVKRCDLQSINDLCSLLRGAAGPQLKQQVVEAMTTHETLFFRDPGQFETLRKTALPALIDALRPTKRMSLWSAAASSGQEAYSLAMMLLEMGLGDWNISILGTDLSEQILDRAREGRYSQLEVNRGLPAPLLVKYFDRRGLDWQLKEQVRRMVTFRTFDLRRNLRTLGPFDVVLCRNVLIYFDLETKKQILEQVRRTIPRGGYLLLGGAETTLCLADKFERIQAHGSVMYRVR